MLKTFRVYFQRTTTVQLYLDVQADDEAGARARADAATSEDDGTLTEAPESYEYDCGPTGEIEELELDWYDDDDDEVEVDDKAERAGQ